MHSDSAHAWQYGERGGRVGGCCHGAQGILAVFGRCPQEPGAYCLAEQAVGGAGDLDKGGVDAYDAEKDMSSIRRHTLYWVQHAVHDRVDSLSAVLCTYRCKGRQVCTYETRRGSLGSERAVVVPFDAPYPHSYQLYLPRLLGNGSCGRRSVTICLSSPFGVLPSSTAVTYIGG